MMLSVATGKSGVRSSGLRLPYLQMTDDLNNVLEHINVADIFECLMLDSQDIQGFCDDNSLLGALWCVPCSWPPIIAFNC